LSSGGAVDLLARPHRQFYQSPSGDILNHAKIGDFDMPSIPDNEQPLASVDLHPVDIARLEILGDLPDVPLVMNPDVLRRLREAPSSLDTIETSDRFFFFFSERGVSTHSQYTYRSHLLKPRIEAYARALEIYADADGSFGGKFSQRLQNCRKQAYFVQHIETHEIRVQSSRCKLRWCPICRDVSRHIVTTAVAEWLKEQKYPKMLTFTLRHNDDPLDKQISRLYDCFRKIRRRVFFSRKVRGGVWFFQLKWNFQTETWHPHIHCLVSGDFIPQKPLAKLWEEVTGDSMICDVRPIKDPESACTEVARYATSPADITRMPLEQALDVYYATRDRRICGTWGNARGLKLSPQKIDDHDEWERVADFYFVNVRAQFDPVCRAFMFAYKTGKPYEGPPPQPLSLVYRQELDAMLDFDTPPPEVFDFNWKIEERQGGFLMNFYGDE